MIMKNFLKQQLIVTLFVILCASSIIYYHIVFLPSEKRGEVSLENQIKCRQEGFKLYETEKKEILTSQFYLNPEFKFNEELNTCLYNGGLIEGEYASAFIKDVYTNKELAGYSSFRPKGKEVQIFGDQGKYFELRIKYFPES